MTPKLQANMGASPVELAAASGTWFLVFALMQVSIGELLDRVGPQLTSSVIFALVGAGGSAVFARAIRPWHVSLAMGIIGFGCVLILLATYYIFLRFYAPALFASLAGMSLGIGNLGNIGSSLPKTIAIENFWWRANCGLW